MIRNFIIKTRILIASGIMRRRRAIASRGKRRAALGLAGEILRAVGLGRRHVRNRRWRKAVTTERRRRPLCRCRRLRRGRTALAVFGKWIALPDQSGEFCQRVATGRRPRRRSGCSLGRTTRQRLMRTMRSLYLVVRH